MSIFTSSIKVMSQYGIALLLALFVSCAVRAENLLSEPHLLVKDTTENVLELLNTGIDPSKSPDEFIEKLSAILDPVVAFDYIARGVMGTYAKQASPEQQKQFSQSFKKGLVNTYGTGISGFNDLDIAVIPPASPLGDAKRTTVLQEVRSPSGVVNIAYSMAKNRQGQWKMINLVLNGINFGQTFRGQFAAAVEKNNGDIDKTIKQWEEGIQ